MRSATLSILIAAGAGALLGWFSTTGNAGGARTLETAWSAPTRPPVDAGTGETLFNALMATNHFGAVRDATETQTADAHAGSDVSPPPRIAGTAVKDGEITVSAYGPGDKFVTVSVGGTLPGGWTVTAATLDRVKLRKGDQDLEIAVFPRDDTES